MIGLIDYSTYTEVDHKRDIVQTQTNTMWRSFIMRLIIINTHGISDKCYL